MLWLWVWPSEAAGIIELASCYDWRTLRLAQACWICLVYHCSYPEALIACWRAQAVKETFREAFWIHKALDYCQLGKWNNFELLGLECYSLDLSEYPTHGQVAFSRAEE